MGMTILLALVIATIKKGPSSKGGFICSSCHLAFSYLRLIRSGGMAKLSIQQSKQLPSWRLCVLKAPIKDRINATPDKQLLTPDLVTNDIN